MTKLAEVKGVVYANLTTKVLAVPGIVVIVALTALAPSVAAGVVSVGAVAFDLNCTASVARVSAVNTEAAIPELLVISPMDFAPLVKVPV